jgi:hypothetical protein
MPSFYTYQFDAHVRWHLDIALDDLPEIHGDPRDDGIYFLGDVMLVDEGNSDN